MKQKLTLSFIILSVLLLLASCAETPDEDIVHNKGEGTVESIIHESEGNGIEISEDNTHQKLSFTDENGVVNYNIDAEVVTPEVNQVSVYQVSPHFFTSEEIERIARAALGDADVYEYTRVVSKPQIQKMILKKQQSISDMDALTEYYEGHEDSLYINMQIKFKMKGSI